MKRLAVDVLISPACFPTFRSRYQTPALILDRALPSLACFVLHSFYQLAHYVESLLWSLDVGSCFVSLFDTFIPLTDCQRSWLPGLR